MSEAQNPVTQLLHEDPRYRLEAYQFVREALSYAKDVLLAGDKPPAAPPETGGGSLHARKARIPTGT